MKIGVLAVLTDQSGDAGDVARQAEAAGFESIWVPDHLVIPVHYDTAYPRSADGKIPEFYAHLVDPLVALASAAQATRQIRLGTMICLLAQRNPIATAKALATIDLYSKGRLILAVGAGWSPEEAEIMGVQFARRWNHLRESVEALRELWGKDEASYEGEFVRFPKVKLFPRPVQKPLPPILLGAHDRKYALKRVARFADGWCPAGLTPEEASEDIPEIKRLAREADRDPEALEFTVSVGIPDPGSSAFSELIHRYREAGGLVIPAMGAATGDGVEAIKDLGFVVGLARKA